jgi:hypothetical protein
MKERIQSFFASVAAAIDRLANFSILALISISLLLVIAAWLNPAKAGSYLWAVCKLSMAAVMGEGFWRAMSRGQTSDDVLAVSMRQTQRATLIAASIIAAGLLS